MPENAGALLRVGACLGIPVDIIEPCGFVLGDRRLRRAGVDYLAAAAMTRHQSWPAFVAARGREARVVLLPTAAAVPHHRFPFAGDDIILPGAESAPVPTTILQATRA